MRARIVIGVLVVIVAGIALMLMWGGREPPTDESATVGNDEPAVSPPAPPRAVTPPERARAQRPVAVDAAGAMGEPPATPEPADAADPTTAVPTVPELLAKGIADFQIEGAKSLRHAFGLLSGVTGAPIHVDLESVKALDEHDGLALQMVGVAGTQILEMMAMVAGFEATVLDDKVVLHPQDVEWTEERRTVLIEPVVPDPDAPTSISVRGRVVDADGIAFGEAQLLLGGVVAGVADASGSFEVEVRPKNQMLTARAPMRQRSAPFNVQGEYGATLETELVLGPPAGGVRVRLSHADGELPDDVRVRLVWSDPIGPEYVTIEGVRQKGRSEHILPDDEGVASFDGAAPGEVVVRVFAKGYRTETKTIDVAEGAWVDIAVELVRELLEDRLRATRISFNFTDTAVDAVVGYISRSAGVNVVLLPSAREGSSAARVTLSSTDDTVESALHAVCSAIGDVTWRIQGDLVLIDKRER